MTRIKLLVRTTAAMVLLVGGIGEAQEPPKSAEERRPYRGLFGSPAASDAPQSLTLSASVFAAYDDNVYAGVSQRQVSAPWLQRSGAYQGASAGLNYTFLLAKDERFDLRGRADGQLNYFRHPDRSDVMPGGQADVSLGVRLTRSLKLDLRESVAYTSTYNGTLSPRPDETTGHDIGLPTDSVLDLFELRALRTASSVNLVQDLGRHLSVNAGYHHRSFELLDSDASESRFRDYRIQTASAGIKYVRPVSRHANLRLGYGLRASDRESAIGEPRIMHVLDVGMDYSRALSFSRRTALTFGTGSAIAVNDRIDRSDSRGRTRAHLTGQVGLTHELGRTWTASAGYSRGFRTRDGFEDLYFTDAVTANIGGLVTRRLSASATAAWADSTLQYSGAGRHRGASATARADYALTRGLAVYASYVYYHYNFGDLVVLDPRFARQVDRNGVRVGLTTTLPLLR